MCRPTGHLLRDGCDLACWPMGHLGPARGPESDQMTEVVWSVNECDKVALQLADAFISESADYKALGGRPTSCSWSSSDSCSQSAGTLTPQDSLSTSQLAPASPQVRS